MSGRTGKSRQGGQQAWRVPARFDLGGVMKAGLSPYRVLVGFLVLTFAIGGGSRGDMASLVVLRPLSALALGYGLAGLTSEQVRSYRWLFAIAAACVAVVAVNLVPLPPAMFYGLPGRGVVADVDQIAGIEGVWRPMSLAPAQSWNALWSLMAPLAVLVLGARVSAGERRDLVAVVLALGLVSAAIASVQVFADPHGVLYFYDDTNNGMAVGLFANRNHQAVFLATLLLMLGAWAGQRGAGSARISGGKVALVAPRVLVALVAGITVIPLILIAGSRAGLLTGLVALICLPLVTRPRRAVPKTAEAGSAAQAGPGWSRWLVVGAIVAIAGALITATLLAGRAEAFNRLVGTSAIDELRLRILPVLRTAIEQYLPIGSGPGSFKPVYRIHEPDGLLALMIVNHAHNDWLEVAMVAGIPGILILLVCAVAWLAQAVRLIRAAPNRRGLALARLGLVVIALLAMASLGDYPLRVPSLACVMVICALWSCAKQEADE